MMYTMRIKLTSPILGAKNVNGVMSFERDREGFILLNMDSWSWCWETAFANTAIYRRAVRMARRFPQVSTVNYDRRLRNPHGPGYSEVAHECIRKGAVLTLALRVVSIDPQDIPELTNDEFFTPDKYDLERALKIIGEDLGISPFGKHIGYGRFDLIELNEEPNSPPVLGVNLPDHLPGNSAATSDPDDPGKEDGQG